MLGIYLSMVETEAEKIRLHHIYVAYNKLMLRIAQDILGNREDAEDAVQNAFLGIAKCLNRVPSEENPDLLRAYVCVAAKNTALSIQKQNQKWHDSQEHLEDVQLQTDGIFEQIMKSHDAERLNRIVRQLPQVYREALYLVYCMGHTQSKAAIIAGCSASNFRQRVVRARKALVKLYQKEGIADE